ncbi:MAG: YhdP family protein [Halothiobacillaceae bacterium]
MQLTSLVTVPLRFIRRVLLPLLGLLIIVLAVLLSAAKLALPLFDEQARSLVERAALERGLALTVERLSLDWEGLGPRLTLHNTQIMGASDTAPLQLQTLSLHLDVPQCLFSGQLQFNTLEISGLILHLQRETDARWSLSSLGTKKAADDNTSANWPAWMGMARRVVLRQSELHVLDKMSGLDLSIHALEALFEHGVNAENQPEQRFALKMQLPESLGGLVEMRARLQGVLSDLKTPSGEVWLDTPQLKLPGWRALFASLPNGDLTLPVALSDLPQLQTGELNAQTWFSLKHGELIDVQASFDFSDILLKRTQPVPTDNLPPPTLLTPLASHVNIHLQHQDTRWMFALDTAPKDTVTDKLKLPSLLEKNTTETIQRFSMRREGEILELAAEHIDLSLLRPWLIATPILPETLRRSLQRHQPLGIAHDMRLRLDLSPDIPSAQGHARLTELGWQGYDNLPGATGVDAQLWLDGTRALLRLDSENISIDSMGQLRERLRFQNLQGDVAIFLPTADTPDARNKIAIHGLKLTNPDLALALDLRLDLPSEASPLIDARGSLSNVATERIPAYLPIKEMDKDTLDWLDLALAGSQGFVPYADLRLYGALEQFPYFLHDSGHFSVRVDFEHLNLNYAPLPAPGWPAAEKLYGQLAFINNGLSGSIQQGQIKGVMLDQGTLAIPDFDMPRLQLALDLHGQSEQMLDVLKHSPLLNSPKDLDDLKLSGAAELKLDMGIQLSSRDPIPDRVEGWFTPQNARLETFGLDFSKLNGSLHFINLDFDSDKLTAQFKQNPASIQVSSHLGANIPRSERGYHIEVDTETQLSDWFEAPAPSILEKLGGQFPLNAKLVLSDDPLNNPKMQTELASSLRGLQIDLPAPLHKPAEEARPTTARLIFEHAKLERIDLNQPQQLEAQFKLNAQGITAGNIHFGSNNYGKPAELKAQELLLSGTLDSLDVDAWMTALTQDNPQENSVLPPSLRLSNKIQQLRALDTVWSNVAIEGTHTAQGWNIELDAPNISGQLIMPPQPSLAAPLDIQLSRLMFAENKDDTRVTPALEKKRVPSPIDPASLPFLHLNIRELSYGDTKVGEIDLRAAPQPAASTPQGTSAWLIEPLKINAPNLTLQGKAAWQRSAEGHPLSTLELDLNSDNVGAALTHLGIKHSLREGTLDESKISLSWPGGLHQFDWGGAHGQGQIQVLDGKIDKVELGAGRVLGLISLTELPRRLALDFGDVFGNGLHFERLTSEMSLRDGLLNTQKFELASSALKLKVSGHSNILDQTLHYQMEATPSLGNVLPIVGTVAGGPIIGGATFVAQKLFELAGGSFMTMNYQISGTWENPIIERRQAPAEDKPNDTPQQIAP